MVIPGVRESDTHIVLGGIFLVLVLIAYKSIIQIIESWHAKDFLIKGSYIQRELGQWLPGGYDRRSVFVFGACIGSFGTCIVVDMSI